ncbi:MAG: radical SAM protein [Leptospiraceae bacterium]|nr:radical SAM protein [Leptospiraceae bacterium]
MDLQPHILTIEVSKKCNLKCGHCFARNPQDPKPALSLETAKEIALEGRQIGFTCLHITGGEPTLWKHFLTFLQFCLELGYEQVYFNTNGMYLQSSLCKELSTYKSQLNISISLDGDEILHNSLRGNSTFQKACLGIQTALEYELPLEVFTLARKSLLPKLPHFVKMVYENFLKIKHLVLIQLVNVENSFQNMTDELLSPEDFITLVKSASLLNLYGYRVLQGTWFVLSC